MWQQDIINTPKQHHIVQQLKDSGIKHLRLFESYAQGNATDESDIDLLYQYQEKMLKKPNRPIVSWYSLVSALFWKELDMVGVDFLDPLIKDQVLSSKIVIY